MERAINTQLDDLYAFEAAVIPTLNIGPSTCSNITDAQRDQLLDKLNCAINNTDKLSTYIANSTNATLSNDLYRRAALQY